MAGFVLFLPTLKNNAFLAIPKGMARSVIFLPTSKMTFQFVVDTCIVPTNMHPHMNTLLRDHVLFSYLGLSIEASQTIIASEEPISEPPFD